MADVLTAIEQALADATGKVDPRDMTHEYNTKLSPDEEAAFQKWVAANGKQHDVYDYDMRGAWKSGAAASGNGHFPDTFKKPNHPTFSNESQYAVGPALQGGRWTDSSFTPGPTNLQHRTAQELAEYMARVEPGVKLNLPKP